MMKILLFTLIFFLGQIGVASGISARVLIFVFDHGLPSEGERFLIDEMRYETDVNGHLNVETTKPFLSVVWLSEEFSKEFEIKSGDELILSYYRNHELNEQQQKLIVFKQENLQFSPDNSMQSSATKINDKDEQVIVKPKLDNQFEDIIVLAPKVKGSLSSLLEVRRISQEVSEVLGAEQMSKSGDGDAAASLRRVTGLSMVGGKYIYVRGMGERYSSMTLNGLSLPSPEPARRVVPMDIFPTSILESVVVQKSFSPQRSGEFGGGVIQLKTKSLPEAPFIKIGLGLNMSSTDQQYQYHGGRRDYLGYDDGTRGLPSQIRSVLASGRKLTENNPPIFNEGLAPEELTALGHSLSGHYNIQSQPNKQIPNMTISAGRPWSFADFKLGMQTSVLYATESNFLEKQQAKFDVSDGQSLVKDESAVISQSDQEYKTGALIDLGFEKSDRFKMQYSQIYIHDSNNLISVKEAERKSDSIAKRRITTLNWTERNLDGQQLIATGKFKNDGSILSYNLRGQKARARREQPDFREYTYFQRDSIWEMNTDSTGNRRTWSELNDETSEIALDTIYENTILKLPVKLQFGVNTQNRKRTSDTWRFHFRNRWKDLAQVDLSAPPDEIFSRKNIKPDGFTLTSLTETADSMGADQTVKATYVGTTVEFSPKVSLDTGVRFEEAQMNARTYFYYAPEQPTSRATILMTDRLPSHALTLNLDNENKFRFAISETIARPEFREISTVPFIDDESGYETVGNEKLMGTVIENYDMRWENYFSEEESVSVGIFLKNFKKPIEEIFEPSPNLRKTYTNAERAVNRGLEFDSRVALGNISRNLRRWSIMGNVSFIDSKIYLSDEAQGVQTSSQRPMQGQSPWLANIQLQYERPQSGLNVNLLYNAVGPRITEVGTAGRPDVYEQPFHQVDLVASKKIDKVSMVSFKAKNLIDPVAKSTQGDQVVKSFNKGRSLGVSYQATF
jgi:TonB-dependent receptor